MNLATNSAVMRATNRRLILNMIRLGPVSRSELAQQTHLTRAAITQIIDELLEAQLVEPCPEAAEDASLPASPGRRRTLLRLRRNTRFVFGVYVSRRRCTVGTVDLLGNILAEEVLPVPGSSPGALLAEVAKVIARLQEALGIRRDQIIGIGVSTPGPVDYREGVILNPPNFSRWHHTPICRMLTELTGLPSLLEKDTNARALEEMYFGAAHDASGFMLLQIDEGVGSGVVIHNSLYRGTRGMGTEIGHTTIRFDGPVCSCGGRGCLENYLRIPVLLEGSRFESWEHLAACEHEPDAARLLDAAAEYLAAALVNAVNLYDLEKIILSGDVAAAPQPLLDRLNPLLSSRVLSRTSLQDPPAVSGHPVSRVRTGAMAALYDFFQDRI